MLTEEFTCAREGLTIRGTVFRPDESRGPAYILSHHFLADRGAVRQYAVRLAENGFRAFTYDFCGGGYSPRESVEEIQRKNCAEMSENGIHPDYSENT